jgi:2-polyprenyl-3-methyl-5-hydroxy-6-metoxy-1,4-benzoquinol methylase
LTISGFIKHSYEKFLSRTRNTTTQPEFFIKENYNHGMRPRYFNDDVDEKKILWQPDVYNCVDQLAKMFHCTHIIDVGCGDGTKLEPLHQNYEIFGIDYGDNLEKCRKTFQFGTWLEYNLENSKPIDLSEKILKTAAIICSDVIEHLVDPSILLTNLKNFLKYSPFCVLTTPERDLTRGVDHFGPPDNPYHIREWNSNELEMFLEHSGLNIACMGITASNNKDWEQKTIITVLQNNNSKYSKEKLNILNRKHTKILKYFS